MSPLVSGIATRGSFKRQIILAFVVGFFLLISAFSIYLVNTEKESLYRDSSEATTGLAQSLAVSSLSWVLANDVVGLQEVVRSFQSYPGLRYAMVISPTGRVLAHSDAAKVGQFVADPQSLALLKGPPGTRIVTDDAAMADVALPIRVDGRPVGWARVAVGREKISDDLKQMMWRNTLFVLSATLLSLLAALLIASRLGARIGVLVKVAEEVRSGNMAMRVGIPGGADEITLLADNLNQMLNALARNEERLRAASLYTRSLIEASLDPLVTISAEGKITDVNRATENVTGRSRSELIGTDFCDYFTAPEQARAGYQQVFLKGSVTDYPLALRHRDGHITDVLYNVSVYQGAKGEVLGVFAAARDITEQKRAHEARSRLAAIVESSSDAIIGKTLDGIITSWNRGAEKIYGYCADEINGKPVTTLAPPALHAEAHALLEKVRQGQAVVNHETERVRKDGTRFHVALTLSPIWDDAGHISGISTIARDITERKLDEAALRRLNRELRAISSCNQTLMRAEDEATLLKEICDIVCNEAGYRMAWVGYAEMDAAKTVRAVAWAGVEEGYLGQAGITWADTDRGRGPAGNTIRSGRSTCLQDFGTDPRGAPWHDSALQRGYRSCIALPLKDENQGTFGVFVIYSSEPNVFTPDEIRLLEELAGDLAFGIAVLRTRNERERVEQVLRKSEQDLKDAQRVAHTGSWDWDARTDSITWSEEYYRIYGFDPAQPAPGYEQHLKAYTPESAARLDAAVKRNMETGEPYQLDLELVRPAGEKRWITARSETRRDALGQIIGLRGTAQDITQRKQAEEDIRRLNERFSLSTRAAGLGVWDWNLQKNELVWDDRMYQLYGVKREDFSGAYEAWLKGLHPDDRAASDEISRQARRGEREYDTEFRVVWPDGSIHYLKAYGQCVRDAQGQPVRMIGVNYDITERKQAEEALQASEVRYSSLFRTLSSGVVLTDDAGQIVDANPAAEHILGLTRSEAAERTFDSPDWSIVRPDGTPMPADEYASVRAMHEGRTVDNVEMGVLQPDGTLRWLLTSASPVPVKRLGVCITFIDITERRRAEEQLRRSEHGLAQAQRMAHLGNWELDLASNVLTWSDEIYRIFEIDPKKFGASYEAFLNGIHPDDRDMVNQAYTESVNRKIPYDIVHRLLMKDGRVKYVNEKCETYYGEDGKPLRSVGSVHDITAQKVANIALAALKDDLEQRVRLRTAELEAANKELEAFSYSVSHDLRTPLRAIDGFSRILLDDYTDKLDDEGKRLLKVVRDNTSRMGQLIDDILKFSRAGRLEISHAEIEMARLAREVFEELRPDVAGDKLQLEIGPIRPATGDPAMMRQVWANLLSNAIKFSRPKEAARIRVGSFVEGDETVYFVEDNGVGFDMRYADKLFGVFQRLHGVDEFEGTGIGLAIVKRIVTRHGGRVWAEGRVDQGATIYFALPNKEKEHG